MLASLTLVARALSRARTLEARERWSRDRLEVHQRVALGDLIRRVAQRSAFWRRHWIDAHLRTMTGDALFGGDMRVMASSGSTGERGRFVYDADGWQTFLASCLRWTRWMGVTPRLQRLRAAAIGAPDGKNDVSRRGLTATWRCPA